MDLAVSQASLILYLTLTSVVFELSYISILITNKKNLTLTSVVFELARPDTAISCSPYLTLTSVVFESTYIDPKIIDILTFNFNKCCI